MRIVKKRKGEGDGGQETERSIEEKAEEVRRMTWRTYESTNDNKRRAQIDQYNNNESVRGKRVRVGRYIKGAFLGYAVSINVCLWQIAFLCFCFCFGSKGPGRSVPYADWMRWAIAEGVPNARAHGGEASAEKRQRQIAPSPSSVLMNPSPPSSNRRE